MSEPLLLEFAAGGSVGAEDLGVSWVVLVVDENGLRSFCPPRNTGIAYMDIVVVRLPDGLGIVVGVQAEDKINVPSVCVLAQVPPCRSPWNVIPLHWIDIRSLHFQEHKSFLLT